MRKILLKGEKMKKTCEHCGRCCQSGIPCLFGQILFDTTELNPQLCPALIRDENNKYWCGLLEEPNRWFPQMVGNVKWKCEAMADIARIYIGIGQGCGINPSASEIMVKMREYASSFKKCL